MMEGETHAVKKDSDGCMVKFGFHDGNFIESWDCDGDGVFNHWVFEVTMATVNINGKGVVMRGHQINYVSDGGAKIADYEAYADGALTYDKCFLFTVEGNATYMYESEELAEDGHLCTGKSMWEDAGWMAVAGLSLREFAQLATNAERAKLKSEIRGDRMTLDLVDESKYCNREIHFKSKKEDSANTLVFGYDCNKDGVFSEWRGTVYDARVSAHTENKTVAVSYNVNDFTGRGDESSDYDYFTNGAAPYGECLMFVETPNDVMVAHLYAWNNCNAPEWEVRNATLTSKSTFEISGATFEEIAEVAVNHANANAVPERVFSTNWPFHRPELM